MEVPRGKQPLSLFDWKIWSQARLWLFGETANLYPGREQPLLTQGQFLFSTIILAKYPTTVLEMGAVKSWCIKVTRERRPRTHGILIIWKLISTRFAARLHTSMVHKTSKQYILPACNAIFAGEGLFKIESPPRGGGGRV